MTINEQAITVVAESIPTPIDTRETLVQQALQHYGTLVDFVRSALQSNVDYGIVPGTKKPTLFKPGAEKLCRLFQLNPRFELTQKIEDWTGQAHGLDAPLFHYHYRCTLWRNGEIIAEGEASCNSHEKKYKNGRVFDSVNTICKMAQKRALVAAVLVATGASEFFTQDMEDLADRFDQDPEKAEKDGLITETTKQIKAIAQVRGVPEKTITEELRTWTDANHLPRSRSGMNVSQLHILRQYLQGLIDESPW
jgi:hypothetical protein